MDLEGLKDMLKPMSKSCKTKTGVSDAVVAGTKDGLFPKERPLMCFLKCLSVMLKAMNKKGEFTLRDLNKQIDLLIMEDLAPRMKAVVKKCVDNVPPSDDPCELAYNMVVCGYNEDSSLYFLPS
ncbi:general odorant-binding protein 83a-like isoform X2 [Phymastichus coffea]|nr:general odorant-binding protein 83a-like isoform X2 [Phymastichus coffea]